ncbi:MAG: CobW family GTP-binding protein [Opitutaceae bacterium]
MHSDPRPPVTILCGFLGAGKTTLLNHLLGQTEGERWALVVNDVAAVNVDARQVAVRVEALSGVEAPPVVELGNGCVCCSSKDDLAESLIQLALTGRPGGPGGRPYDRIVVETTGVAEPKEIARLFTQRNPFGRSPGDVARLAALVTVVDAGAFLRLWREAGPLRSGPLPSAHPVAAAAPRPLIELLIEQVETTDLVVLNKCDRVTVEERAILEAAIAGLNPRADIIAAEQGQVPREVVIDPIRFSERETLGGAAWIRALNALAPIPASAAASSPRAAVVRPAAGPTEPLHERRYGLRSGVFQARRPFRRERLLAALESARPALVRAKGFVWLAEQPDEMIFLSIAGDDVRLETLNYWWAALIENGRARREDRPGLIQALWEEPHGDRRQELVFIGAGLDEMALRAALAAALA